MNEAIKTADQKRKEAVLEAKDEAFNLKAEVDAQKAEADKEIKPVSYTHLDVYKRQVLGGGDAVFSALAGGQFVDKNSL